MNNVLQLLPRRADAVVIDCAHLSETTVETRHGTRRIIHEPTKLSYFVTVCESDGGRILLWDGSTYAEAREEAQKIAVDWNNCAIIDHAGEVLA